ncbi:hypothetical protein U9M48_000376 [Paspalum notatum var. saurae]|uniref:DUF4220 domain-containing protein n=1 Tax=Paspalum notatum var. saurae TaxID=547442 RepID=A0AAQ3SEI9_PASNO
MVPRLLMKNLVSLSQLNDLDNVSLAKCDQYVLDSFRRDMDEKLWRVDTLLLASAIMAGVIVGIGAYGQRYRHHRFTRLIFLGASTLFLPIISSVVSSSTVLVSSMRPLGINDLSKSSPALVALCNPAKHSVIVVTWALLVQNIMINTSVVVAVDDREGPSVGPPIELLAQGVWTLYLGITHLSEVTEDYLTYVLTVLYLLELLLFLLTVAKLVFKYYAVRKAQQSYAFGRNPRLVFGYMHQQLPLMAREHDAPPPLLVMGEETRQVEKQHHGYVFKHASSSSSLGAIGLVTIDRVWRQLGSNSMLLPAVATQRLKDVCLSFALFKLLRCRFARYELAAYSGSEYNTSNFFWSLLLKDDCEPDRVFGVIADELSFLHDYYYSSLPINYSKCWLPLLGILVSLSSLGYCIFLAVWMMIISRHSYNYQMVCNIRCHDATYLHLGILELDVIPLVLLLVFLVTAEVRDMVSHVYSDWTKVVLTCRLLNKELSPSMRKWALHILRRRRCRLMKHWDEEVGQCSVLPHLRPRRTTPLAFVVRRLLHLPDEKTEVSAAVKVSLIDALRSSRDNGEHLSNGKASLRRWGQQGERLLWACNSKSASVVILTWQIATSILEVRDQQQQGSSSLASDCHMTVATCLSRYCAYLVSLCPELLPDDDAWSKGLYEAVNKDARRALARLSSSTPDHQQLVKLLNDKSNHMVLKNGAKLGQQLVEETTIDGEETAWKLLAGFWSEMILYVAPSDNLKGHKEAIARGGELITLLWALLNHAGIISRTTSSSDDARV